MYLPPKFKNQETAELLEIIQRYPLATVISVNEGEPYVSHLPLVAEVCGEEIVLVGHLARANPHSRLLSHGRVTVLFHGPNAYITPKWYVENSVPTWNYAVVHAKGTVELLETFDGIVDCLKLLTKHAERGASDPWKFWLPEDLSTESDLCSAIVGFRIRVEEIVGKFKLSQNRSAEDRAGVMRGLAERRDEMSREVLGIMEKGR